MARPPAHGCWLRRSARRPPVRLPRHAGRGARRCSHARQIDDSRCREPATRAGAVARRRRGRGGDGGVLARARPATLRGRALPDRGLHEPQPRSPRLSRRHERLRRGQGIVVRLADTRRARHQRRRPVRRRTGFARHPWRHADRDRPLEQSGAARSRRALRARTQLRAPRRWPRARARQQLGHGHVAQPFARRFQRRQPAHGARRAARRRHGARGGLRSAGALRSAAGPHAAVRRRRVAGCHRRLRPYAGCARQGAARGARALLRTTAVRVRLRRRSRPRQAPEMGAVAESLADALYITDDNPRGEDPQRIVDDIRAGLAQPCARADRTRSRGRDRRGAGRRGRRAMSCWSPARDTRTTSSCGSERRAFSDLAQVRAALAKRSAA